MEWCNIGFPFYNCCNLQCFQSEPLEMIAIEITPMISQRSSLDNIVTKVNNDDTIAYPYLYNDPEMELWFQKHCRTWGFKELYI